jgi:hypothetical protein
MPHFGREMRPCRSAGRCIAVARLPQARAQAARTFLGLAQAAAEEASPRGDFPRQRPACHAERERSISGAVALIPSRVRANGVRPPPL